MGKFDDDIAEIPPEKPFVSPRLKVVDGDLVAKTGPEIWEEARKQRIAEREMLPQYKLWERLGLQLTQTGGPIANLTNAVAVLQSDKLFKDIFWFDEFLQRIVTINGSAIPREWGDADDINTALYMQREIGIPKIGRDLVNQAVISVSRGRTRNCAREWMEKTEHDGTERIDNFFSDYMGAPATEYVKSASRNFWLSIAARVYSPGCKVDSMIVLEGPQGVGKSTALHIIGGEWFAEQHESATNPKAFAEILQGKLLIEISEMDAFSRAEVNRVKQTISC